MNKEKFRKSMNFVRSCAPKATVHDGLFVKQDDIDNIDNHLK